MEIYKGEKMEIGRNTAKQTIRVTEYFPPVSHKGPFHSLGVAFLFMQTGLREIMPRLTDFICCLYMRKNGREHENNRN